MHSLTKWLPGVALATTLLAQEPPYKDTSLHFEKRAE
jgi:hypothetical protein